MIWGFDSHVLYSIKSPKPVSSDERKNKTNGHIH